MGLMDFLGGIGGAIGDTFSSGADWLSNLGGGGSSGFDLQLPQNWSGIFGNTGGGQSFGGFQDLNLPDLTSTPTQGWSGVDTSLAAPSLATSGSTGGDWLTGLGNAAKTIAPIAGMGLTGMGIASGIQGQQQAAQQNKLLQKAQQYQQQTAQPAAAAGSALTQAGEAAMLGGALPPQLEAQVNAWGEQQRQQLRQYFAHAGISDSTMMQQMEGWIQEQQQLMRSQLAQNLLGSGYAGISAGLAGADSLARSSGLQQGQQNQGLYALNNAIAQLTGSQRPPQNQG